MPTKFSFPFWHVTLAVAAFSAAACGRQEGDDGPTIGPNRSALLAGGDATVFDESSSAFRAPLPGLTAAELEKHLAGDAFFESKFVTAPAPVHAGLGPYFNNNECEACHTKDGRGSPTLAAGGLGSQMLVIISQESGVVVDPGGPKAVPDLGLQVRDQAVVGAEPAAKLELVWTEEAGTYGDGTPYSLRRPQVTVTLANGKALADDVLMSVRQPTAVFGLGLLEAVDDATLDALAASPDKVAGHVNTVWSRSTNAVASGRFGRKAGKATLREQAAKALALDMGVTNELFPDGDGNAKGAALEASADDLDTISFYLKTLAVPARRGVDNKVVQHGEAIFHQIGCNGCHVTEMTTGTSPIPSLAHQAIHPYSDLLLHDMGDGLADGRAEFEASGSEWRTATLWGIGLTQTVHPYASYLHDGRARTLQEAILWHGGQAAAFREAFKALPADDRDALVKFLDSL